MVSKRFTLKFSNPKKIRSTDSRRYVIRTKTMSTTAKEEAPSSFTSLPNDIVFNILARVPRRYHPILGCVSKNLQSLVRSSELQKTRSLMGKEYCFYVCIRQLHLTYHWFILTENGRLVPIPFPYPPEPFSTALMVGPEIYFVGGFSKNLSRSMWILDSRSGKLRQGPSTLVPSRSPAVGIVDEKIYMFGGCCDDEDKEIQAQVFDPKKQTWQIAANPSVELQYISMSMISPSLDRKIYAKNDRERATIVYDPRDGNCEIITLPADNLDCCKDVCVIENVLYIYHSYLGVMWYSSKEKKWIEVHGLKFNYYNNRWNLKMAEYNGKLAILWHDCCRMEIWCTMIALRRLGVVAVKAQVEWSSCVLANVHQTYNIMHCLGRTDY